MTEKPFNIRALVIGFMCVIFLSIATPCCDLVMRGTWIASAHLLFSGGHFILLAMLWAVHGLCYNCGSRYY